MKKIDVNDIKKYGKFAVILKCMLAKNKITQSDLAKMTGLSEATITHYVKGKTTPSQTNIDKIANALNISPRAFYGDIDEFAPYLNQTETIFSQKINSLLNERGLSQEQLAKEIGVSRQTVNYYVNGKSLPTSDVLIKIAEFFSVTVESLFATQTEKEEVNTMKIKVSEMPIKKGKCLFIKGDYINESYECMFGGLCTLKDGVCARLEV